jgi:hypothetical protein
MYHFFKESSIIVFRIFFQDVDTLVKYMMLVIFFRMLEGIAKETSELDSS